MRMAFHLGSNAVYVSSWSLSRARTRLEKVQILLINSRPNIWVALMQVKTALFCNRNYRTQKYSTEKVWRLEQSNLQAKESRLMTKIIFQASICLLIIRQKCTTLTISVQIPDGRNTTLSWVWKSRKVYSFFFPLLECYRQANPVVPAEMRISRVNINNGKISLHSYASASKR